MKNTKIRVVFLLGAILISLFAVTINTEAKELETIISLSYREKIALPSNTSAEIYLVEQDVESSKKSIIKEEKKQIETEVPIDLKLELDAKSILADKDYLIQALIKSSDNQILWFKSQEIKGDSFGEQSSLEIILNRPQYEVKVFATKIGTVKLHALDNMAQVIINKQEFILPQVRTASGVKYANEEISIWNKGEELLIELTL